jgi:hypothetical protein
MPLVSKTLEVNAEAATILAIVADFEAYPHWNDEVKAVYILARYNDGRPSQLRIDTEIQGQQGTYIQAVYYPGPAQMGPSSLLTVDLDVETSIPGVPAPLVKKLVNDALDHLAGNLKARAEQLVPGADPGF